jgi:hypothetical protein
MALEQTLNKVENDIKDGDLGKARDRLHGLLVSYPDNLELRKRLGDIYWRLQIPDMAGRYWYLEENKDGIMAAACHRFEKQFNSDPVNILLALKFRGNFDRISDACPGQILLDLHQKAKEKHSWYEDFRNKSRLKYHRYNEKTVEHKTRDILTKFGCIFVVVLLAFLSIVGVISVIRWFI